MSGIVKLGPLANSRRKQRTGAIAVFAAIMIVVVLSVVAFAVDLGYLAIARTEAQRTADATAHAAAIEFARSNEVGDAMLRAIEVSAQFTANNLVLGEVADVAPLVDVKLGRHEFGSGQTELHFGNPKSYNAVKIRIRKTDEQNGAVPLFFAKVMDRKTLEIETEAIAALIRNVSGFKIPPSGQRVPMLPIAIKETYWESAKHGHGTGDDWAYDAKTDNVSSGSDGIAEVALFPHATGSSGNLGTLNIGTSNNSTSYIGSQIRKGLSASDLSYHGGKLELGGNGQLSVSGNPGLSASIQKDLKEIVGQVRVIPLYRNSTGNGNNATFQIVKFVAVRIMSAHLSGGNKAIKVQPASFTYDGVIQGSLSGQSEGIYSSPRIVN